MSSMSTAFTGPCISFTPRVFSSRKPSKTRHNETSILTANHKPPLLHCKYNPGFRISRPSFKSSVRIQDSEPETSDREKRGQVKESNFEGKAEQKRLPNLKSLIEAYKQAFLSGDEKSVSEIEAMMYLMETEKNELAQTVAALSSDIASGKEKYIRLHADFENFRKRIEKDRLTLTSNAKGEVVESLLPIVDNFERAKQQIRPETEKGKKINTSYQGIYKQFVETMRSLRVSVVETVGKPFDPTVHEAIAREESHEFKQGIIIQEVRRGFLLQGKLLRPAIVKVSAGPGNKKAPVISKESFEQPQPTAALD